MPIELHPIGVIKTPFSDRYSAPRQPLAGKEYAEGIITLERGQNFEQALLDLRGMDKIWLLYQFHRNTNWKPMVLPPRSRNKRGVFATRSPHRPNPIGLSLVDLVSVKGLKITVGGVDLLDGTPILDIKPYLPATEAFPDARTGWLEEVEHVEYGFKWSRSARSKAKRILESTEHDIVKHTERVLSAGVQSHPYKRISRSGDEYMLAYKYWRIAFTITGNIITVNSVFDAETIHKK